MSEEFGPWIKHDGSACPLPLGAYVQTKRRCPKDTVENGAVITTEGPIEPGSWANWDWSYFGTDHPFDPETICSKVLRYRVRKPLAVSKETAREESA